MPAVNTISYPSERGTSSRSVRSAFEGWADRVYTAIHRWRWLSRERNLFAAFFTLLALTVLSASLADEEWIYLEGGRCGLKHIGVTLFYGWGSFRHRTSTDPGLMDNGQPRLRTHIVYRVGGRDYYDCVNQTIADVFHGLMGVLFVAVSTTLAAFVLDTFGVKQGFLAWLRRHSIFNVFTVIFCVIVIGLTYWISVEVEQQQRGSVSKPEMVRVSFEDGFYLVVAGAAFSICALIANLVKSTIQMKRRCDDRLALLEHMERNEVEGAALGIGENLLHNYHQYRRRLLGMAMATTHNSRADVTLVDNPTAGTVPPPPLITERPIGSTGPPPPLQMILNVPPPPPYSP